MHRQAIFHHNFFLQIFIRLRKDAIVVIFLERFSRARRPALFLGALLPFWLNVLKDIAFLYKIEVIWRKNSKK